MKNETKRTIKSSVKTCQLVLLFFCHKNIGNLFQYINKGIHLILYFFLVLPAKKAKNRYLLTLFKVFSHFSFVMKDLSSSRESEIVAWITQKSYYCFWSFFWHVWGKHWSCWPLVKEVGRRCIGQMFGCLSRLLFEGGNVGLESSFIDEWKKK